MKNKSKLESSIKEQNTPKKSNEEKCENFIKEQNALKKSNEENYDRTIITLSGVFLSISIGFMSQKNVLISSGNKLLLVCGWILLFLSIASVTFSYYLSNKAIVKKNEYAQKCLEENKEEYRYKKSCEEIINNWVNKISGILFIIGVSFILLSAILNIV